MESVKGVFSALRVAVGVFFVYLMGYLYCTYFFDLLAYAHIVSVYSAMWFKLSYYFWVIADFICVLVVFSFVGCVCGAVICSMVGEVTAHFLIPTAAVVYLGAMLASENKVIFDDPFFVSSNFLASNIGFFLSSVSLHFYLKCRKK